MINIRILRALLQRFRSLLQRCRALVWHMFREVGLLYTPVVYQLMHCSTLQHTAAHYNTLPIRRAALHSCCILLRPFYSYTLHSRCVSVSVLQCVAVCCSVLQCVAVCCSVLPIRRAALHSRCRSLGPLLFIHTPVVYTHFF